MSTSTIIKFEPAIECGTYNCGNMATVATVERAPSRLGDIMPFPPVRRPYLFMPICEPCVNRMQQIYGGG